MRLGVLGHPVAHSLSPTMHNAALRAVGLSDWRYQLLPVPPELLGETVRALEAAGFRGANVTIPHKGAALVLADVATGTARAVGAANTLTFEDGRIHADNTDVAGLLAAIPARHAPAGRRALVIGAGGAGRAAACALLKAGVGELMVWNRTIERAERLCADLGAGRAVTRLEPADLVVQCTSVGLRHEDHTFKALPVEADTFSAGSCVVDMVYRDGGTPFLAEARKAGADVVDGLEILIAQGAASFERWTGRPAPLDVMRGAVTDHTHR